MIENKKCGFKKRRLEGPSRFLRENLFRFCLYASMFMFFQCVGVIDPAYAQEVLTNDSILKMVKAGLSENLIVDMISSHEGHYLLTSDGLVKLKQEGVSDRIIGEMMAKGGGSPSAPAAPAAMSSPTSSAGLTCPSKFGAFYLDTDGWKPMSEVMMSGSRTKVVPVPVFTSVKMMSKYPGTEAPITVSNNPVFCVSGSHLLRNMAIASLDVKGDHRELQRGSGHAFTGPKSGIPDKKLQPIEVKQISDSSAEIRVKTPLESGQYMLFMTGSEGAGYDFGVKVPE